MSKLTDLIHCYHYIVQHKQHNRLALFLLISYGASFDNNSNSQQNHSVLLVLDPVRHDFIKFCQDDSDSSSDWKYSLHALKDLCHLTWKWLIIIWWYRCLWLATNHPTEWTSSEKRNNDYRHIPNITIFREHHQYQDRATRIRAEIIDQWVTNF